MEKVEIKRYAAIAKEVSKQEESDIPSFDEFIKHVADKNDFGFFLKNRDKIIKRIKELEAKFAESEYKVQTLLKSKDVLAVTDIAKMSVDNFNLRKENSQLKQQLIDECKEHQEFCKVADEKVKNLEKEVSKWKNKKIKCLVDHLIGNKDLAIEELEKVKEWCKERYDGWKTSYNHEQIIEGVCYSLENINIFIDQQIKSLKGEG